MASQAPAHYFSEPANEHEPSLYAYDEVATPITGIDSVDDDAVSFFEENGYLAVADIFDQAKVDAACAAITDLATGAGADALPVNFEAHAKGNAERLEGEARELAIRKLMSFKGKDARLDELLYDQRVLGLLDRLGCVDPQVFQTMALIKGPNGREKPWHQDHAYFNATVDSKLVGVWIALDEATPENGCMRVMPHHREPVVHWSRRDWQICDKDAKAMADYRVAVPLKPGGALFFSSLLPHGTPINKTTQRRRALQYHYIPRDYQTVTVEERMEVFGSEGKDVSC